MNDFGGPNIIVPAPSTPMHKDDKFALVCLAVVVAAFLALCF